jgi:hypothetical protein
MGASRRSSCRSSARPFRLEPEFSGIDAVFGNRSHEAHRGPSPRARLGIESCRAGRGRGPPPARSLEIGHRADAVAGRRAGDGGACLATVALSPAAAPRVRDRRLGLCSLCRAAPDPGHGDRAGGRAAAPHRPRPRRGAAAGVARPRGLTRPWESPPAARRRRPRLLADPAGRVPGLISSTSRRLAGPSAARYTPPTVMTRRLGGH